MRNRNAQNADCEFWFLLVPFVISAALYCADVFNLI
jgi:hypothetical protein